MARGKRHTGGRVCSSQRVISALQYTTRSLKCRPAARLSRALTFLRLVSVSCLPRHGGEGPPITYVDHHQATQEGQHESICTVSLFQRIPLLPHKLHHRFPNPPLAIASPTDDG